MRLDSCSQALDSEGAAAAKLLLESYVKVAEKADKGSPSAGHSVFQPFNSSCLLFARKFRGPTADAMLELVQHPSFHEWNYTAAIAAD